MVRLKDIAERAGVSVMTVSKALRDEPDVAAGTKTRIKVLAQQLGYVPDSSAQGLRTRATKLFGVIVPSCTDPFFSRVLLALEEHAYEMGCDVLLMQTLDRPEREEACIRRCLARRVEGLFIGPVYRISTEARVYQELVARRVPTVLLDHPAPFCTQFPSVHTDDLLAGYAATQHLLKLGHRRIAFLTGPAGAPWAAERLEGYRRALSEAGIDVDDRMVFPSGRSVEDGKAAALQFLGEKCPATAIQAVNDLVALGCAEVLLQQGIRIPQDVSLMGFGNIHLSEHCGLPLTTMRQPKYRLGSTAALMMHHLRQGKPEESKRLQAELVVRSSTGTAPASSIGS